MTLTEFLRARFDEDEAPALALYGASTSKWALNADRVMAADLLPAEHDIAKAWDYDRVLAECEAKRRIVERVQANDGITVVDDWVLNLLALPYVDHPDFREEWKS